MTTSSKLDNIDDLRSTFEYRDGELHWKKNGKQAGTKGKRDVRIKINGQRYAAHRLIFMMHHGYMPACVDHINGNPLDNRIENLREATLTQNQFNSKLRKDSKSGVKNVTWNKQRNTWKVEVTVDGVRKSFGSFKDLELAELVAMEVRDKYHKEFANHGAKW